VNDRESVNMARHELGFGAYVDDEVVNGPKAES
jgi:hypothetical protein